MSKSTVSVGGPYSEDVGAPENQRATFNYQESAALSKEIKDVLALFDHDKSGRVTTSDLMAAAHAQQEMRNQNRHLRTLVKMLVAMLLGAMLCIFGLTMAAIELSKETHVRDAVLVTPGGSPVQVESSQLMVAPNGELRMRPERSDGVAEVAEETCACQRASGGRITAGNPTYRLELDLSTREVVDCAWEIEVSDEAAEGLLRQLEAAPDTQVFFVFHGADGTATDLDGRRLQHAGRYLYQTHANLNSMSAHPRGRFLSTSTDEAPGSAEGSLRLPTDLQTLADAELCGSEGRRLVEAEGNAHGQGGVGLPRFLLAAKRRRLLSADTDASTATADRALAALRYSLKMFKGGLSLQ